MFADGMCLHIVKNIAINTYLINAGPGPLSAQFQVKHKLICLTWSIKCVHLHFVLHKLYMNMGLSVKLEMFINEQ